MGCSLGTVDGLACQQGTAVCWVASCVVHSSMLCTGVVPVIAALRTPTTAASRTPSVQHMPLLTAFALLFCPAGRPVPRVRPSLPAGRQGACAQEVEEAAGPGVQAVPPAAQEAERGGDCGGCRCVAHGVRMYLLGFRVWHRVLRAAGDTRVASACLVRLSAVHGKVNGGIRCVACGRHSWPRNCLSPTSCRACVAPVCALPAATESEQQELSSFPTSTSTHPSVELQQRRSARTGSTRAAGA